MRYFVILVLLASSIYKNYAQGIIAPDTVCYGAKIEFSSTYKSPFKWYKDTTLLSTDSICKITAYSSGNYILKSAHSIDTFYLFVTKPFEYWDFYEYIGGDANADSLYCIVQLSDKYNYTYQWLKDGDTNKIKYIFNDNCLPLQVKNRYNCSEIFNICDEYNYFRYQFELPNVLNIYSPILKNRVFQPIGNGVKNISMSIYSIRGECVFKGFAKHLTGYKTPELAWDGKFKGEYCPMGVYVYIVTYTTFDNKKTETFKGILQLIE